MGSQMLRNRAQSLMPVLFCALLACSSCTLVPPASTLPAINASDFPKGAPPVRVVWPVVTVNCLMQQSNYQVDLSPSRKGVDELEIRGKFVSPRAPYSDDQTIDLESLGFREKDLPALKVYWVNADGSRSLLQPETGPAGEA